MCTLKFKKTMSFCQKLSNQSLGVLKLTNTCSITCHSLFIWELSPGQLLDRVDNQLFKFASKKLQIFVCLG